MTRQISSRFWVVRKEGNTVMRFDTPGEYAIVDPEIEEHDAFTVHGIADREGLRGTEMDRSNLTDVEYDILGIPPGT